MNRLPRQFRATRSVNSKITKNIPSFLQRIKISLRSTTKYRKNALAFATAFVMSLIFLGIVGSQFVSQQAQAASITTQYTADQSLHDINLSVNCFDGNGVQDNIQFPACPVKKFFSDNTESAYYNMSFTTAYPSSYSYFHTMFLIQTPKDFTLQLTGDTSILDIQPTLNSSNATFDSYTFEYTGVRNTNYSVRMIPNWNRADAGNFSATFSTKVDYRGVSFNGASASSSQIDLISRLTLALPPPTAIIPLYTTNLNPTYSVICTDRSGIGLTTVFMNLNGSTTNAPCYSSTGGYQDGVATFRPTLIGSRNTISFTQSVNNTTSDVSTYTSDYVFAPYGAPPIPSNTSTATNTYTFACIDGASVYFNVNGTDLPFVTCGANGNIDLNTTLNSGTNTITARQIKNFVTSDTNTYTISYTVLNPPTGTVPGTTNFQNISLSFSCASGASVTLIVNNSGSTNGICPGNNFITLSALLGDGANVLEVKQSLYGTTSGSSFYNVSYIYPPTIQGGVPATTTTNTPTYTVNCYSYSTTTLALSTGGTYNGTCSSGTSVFNPTLPNGPITLTVTQSRDGVTSFPANYNTSVQPISAPTINPIPETDYYLPGVSYSTPINVNLNGNNPSDLNFSVTYLNPNFSGSVSGTNPNYTLNISNPNSLYGRYGGTVTVTNSVTGNTSNRSFFFTVHGAPISDPSFATAIPAITNTNNPSYVVNCVNGATVTLTVNGNSTSQICSASGSVTFNPTLPYGNSTISVIQSKDGITSNPVNATTYVPIPPTGTVDGLTNTASTQNPTYVVHCIPGATVNMVVNGTILPSQMCDTNGTATFTPVLQYGPNSVDVSQSKDGVTSITSSYSTNLPVPAPSSNSIGATSNTHTPTYTFNCIPGATITLVTNGTTQTAICAGNGQTSITTTLVSGNNALTVTQTINNTVSPTLSYTVNDLVPVAVSSDITPTSSTTTPTYTINCTPGFNVEIILNGVSTNSTCDGSGHMSYTPTLLNGNNTIILRQYGNGLVGPDTSYNVNNLVPVPVTGSVPATTDTSTPTYTFNCTSGATVTLLLNGNTTTALCNGSGQVSFTPTVLPGNNTLILSQTLNGLTSTTTNFPTNYITPGTPTGTVARYTNNPNPTYSFTCYTNASVQLTINVSIANATCDGTGYASFTPTLQNGESILFVKQTYGGTTSPTSQFPVGFVFAPTGSIPSTSNTSTPTYTVSCLSSATVTIDLNGTISTTLCNNNSYSQQYNLVNGSNSLIFTQNIGGVTSNSTTYTVNNLVPPAPTSNITPTSNTSTPTYTFQCISGGIMNLTVNGVTTSFSCSGTGNANATTLLNSGNNTLSITQTVGGLTSSATNYVVNYLSPQPPTGTVVRYTNTYLPTLTFTCFAGARIDLVVSGSTTNAFCDGSGSVSLVPTLNNGDNPVSVTQTYGGATSNPSAYTIGYVFPPYGTVYQTSSTSTPTYIFACFSGSVVYFNTNGTNSNMNCTSGTLVYTPTLVSGTNLITVYQVLGGVTSTNTTYTVNDLVPTSVTGTIPATSSTSTPTYTFSCTPGSTVTLSVNGTALPDQTCNNSGTVTFLPTLNPGNNTLVIHQTVGGITGPDTTYTVNNLVPPAPTSNITPTSNTSTPTYTFQCISGGIMNLTVNGVTTSFSCSGTGNANATTLLNSGNNTLSITQTVGGLTSSATNYVVNDLVPPAPTAIIPPTSETATPTYTFTCIHGSSVFLTVNAIALGMVTCNLNNTVDITPTLTSGNNVLVVTQTVNSITSPANTYSVKNLVPPAPVLTLPNGKGTVSISASGDCNDIVSSGFIDESANSLQDTNYDYPFQMIMIKLRCHNPGGSGIVTTKWEINSLSTETYTLRKLAPQTPGLNDLAYYSLLDSVKSVINGSITTYTTSFEITDGKHGDWTVVDGFIIDPYSLATPVIIAPALPRTGGQDTKFLIILSILTVVLGGTSVLLRRKITFRTK